MTKKAIPAKTREEMLRDFPIADLVQDWYFRQREISAGVFAVEGCDVYGRQVSRDGVIDPEGALAECVLYARQLSSRQA